MPAAQCSTAESAREDRIIAFLVDFVLLTIVTVLIWGVFAVVSMGLNFVGMSAAGPDSTAAVAGTFLLGLALSVLQWGVIGLAVGSYFVYFLNDRGQTFGMGLTDVVVVSEDGTAITREQAIKRTLVLLAPMPLMALVSVVVPLVGFLLALFMMVGWLAVEALLLVTDDDAQRLGDRVAGTLVVESAA
ncbi:RDD family protein [Haloarcula amylovorans]|uniref:RDD family protein n=1 Tax=Haloarcula amylovorans TaxID=2562280 RepID=UPI0014302663|nr:RDD family protein [Halomicroarcula amylolytica]